MSKKSRGMGAASLGKMEVDPAKNEETVAIPVSNEPAWRPSLIRKVRLSATGSENDPRAGEPNGKNRR